MECNDVTCFHCAICKNSKDILERLEKLEERLNLLEANITSNNVKDKKTPHKCPLCEGRGIIASPETLRMDILMMSDSQGISLCHGCKGKGIVWG